MAASLLMASSFFVGRVRRLSKGWSFAATQSSGDSAYSPKCREEEFFEVRLDGVLGSSLKIFFLVTFVVTLGRRSPCRVALWR